MRKSRNAGFATGDDRKLFKIGNWFRDY